MWNQRGLGAAVTTLLLTMTGIAMQPSVQAATWTADMTKAADDWDAILQKYVNAKGGVDYVKLNAEGKSDLQKFLNAHEVFDPSNLDDKSKKALYINLYNAGMIYNILRWAEKDKIDIASDKFFQQGVNDISAPGGNIWNGKWTFNLGGKDIHLDQIEHGLIRGKQFDELKQWYVSKLDPRIHAAVNCAAFSCPRVREKAYRPDTIDAMLDENMREYLSTEEQFSKADEEKLKANKIVFWYYDDFDDHGQDVLKLGGAGDYLAKFVGQTAKDAEWKKNHLRKNFNDKSNFSLRFSSAFDFFYDWRIADSRIKK